MKLKTSDLHKGDVVKAPDGELYNVEYIFPEKIVVVLRRDVSDLEGWEKVDMYGKTLRKG